MAQVGVNLPHRAGVSPSAELHRFELGHTEMVSQRRERMPQAVRAYLRHTGTGASLVDQLRDVVRAYGINRPVLSSGGTASIAARSSGIMIGTVRVLVAVLFVSFVTKW